MLEKLYFFDRDDDDEDYEEDVLDEDILDDDSAEPVEEIDPLEADQISRKSLVLFFLIDTSGSMAGTKIGELNTAMEEMIPEIRSVGGADTDVKLAVLTFSSGCRWLTSAPVSVEDFQWDRLDVGGLTDMGKAFDELASKLSRSGFLKAPSISYAPVIFLMTDGYPSDDYKKGLEALTENRWYKYALKVALGIGKEANDDVLKEFTRSPETVVHAHTGKELADMIRMIAVTSSQIGSKSMTLTSEPGVELTESDVAMSKQKELGSEIQNYVKDYTEDLDLDDGWD